MDVEFTWDQGKARSNERKHGIAFEEAVTVFVDENALLIPDPDHSSGEERFFISRDEFQASNSNRMSLLSARRGHGQNHFCS